MPNVRNMNIRVVYRPSGSTLENSVEQVRTSIELKIAGNNENVILVDLKINYKLLHSHPFKLLKGHNTQHSGHTGQHFSN